MNYTDSEQDRAASRRWWTKLIIAAIALLVLTIGGCMAGMPKYRVYSSEMAGRAVLAEAESSRQVKVREALALKDSAQYKAEAEIIRANGVAQANRIITDGLGGPEGYLRYLAIEAMREQATSENATTIYVPTEAGIPITEASRFNKPLHPTKDKAE